MQNPWRTAQRTFRDGTLTLAVHKTTGRQAVTCSDADGTRYAHWDSEVSALARSMRAELGIAQDDNGRPKLAPI